jgi:hypothetical protein
MSDFLFALLLPTSWKGVLLWLIFLLCFAALMWAAQA